MLFQVSSTVTGLTVSVKNWTGNVSIIFGWLSRHAVVCQRPRKPYDAQACYFREPPFHTFSAYCSLKTIGAISTKFIYVVPPIYTTSQTKFERNTPGSLLVTHT